MEKIINCKQIAKDIKSNIADYVKEVKVKRNITPCVVSILVGNDFGSVYYQNKQYKAAKDLGINFIKVNFDSDISEEEIINCIHKYNDDKSVHGIMILLPFPKRIDEKKVINEVNPLKDIDCLTDVSMGRVFKSKGLHYPCTASSVTTILESLNLQMEGKEVVVIGRSNIVGKPVAQMMLDRNATVTICHSRTKNLKEVASRADILISAIGKPKFIGPDYVKDNAIVIDVGTSSLNGKITGDVDLENVIDKVSLITSVPGGVGTLTTAILFRNLCEAVEKCI